MTGASIMERVPEAVAEGAKSGDFSAVRAWLNTVTDVNRYVINDPSNQLPLAHNDYLLLMWTAACGITTPEKVELARELLARGAEVDKTDYVDRTALHWACRGVGDASPALVSLLLSAGADVHARTKHTRTIPIAYTVDTWSLSAQMRYLSRLSTETLLVIFERLLRAGSELDNISEGPFNDSLGSLSARSESAFEALSTDASFQEIKTITAKVLAAGSYRAYLHEQRKKVLSLRSLANRRRAATADPVMNFLVRLGDNGVLWNVLSHWPPPRR